MAATLAAHHASARKIVLAVDQLLENLETGRDTSLQLQSEISQHLNLLAREVQALEDELPTVSHGERSLWKKRIVQLQEQSKSQRAALSKFAGRAAARQRESEERQELLQRRQGGEHAITIDAAARESRNLNEAGAQLDALQEHAMNSLGALVQQRSTLKGVQRKVLDMAQTLGLSNDVLRMMERRQFWDKVVLYGGMLATLALLWFVLKYMRPPVEE
jgi:Golgi SNAP receptor complex protein 2